MLNLRNTLPDMEEVTGQLQHWAKDGYGTAREMAKSDSLVWGVASLGVGALMGGLYALWRRNGKAAKTMPKAAAKTMAVRAHPKRSKRASAKSDGAETPAAKRALKPRANGTRRGRPATNTN